MSQYNTVIEKSCSLNGGKERARIEKRAGTRLLPQGHGLYVALPLKISPPPVEDPSTHVPVGELSFLFFLNTK